MRTFVCCIGLALLACPAFSQGMSAPSSEPKELNAVGDSVFFTADDGVHGRELWRWRAEAESGLEGGAALVEDLYPGATGSDPHFLSGYGDWLYFVADNQECKDALWVCGFEEKAPRQVKTADGKSATLKVIVGSGSEWFYFFGHIDGGPIAAVRTRLGSSVAEPLTSNETTPDAQGLGVALSHDSVYYCSSENSLRRITPSEQFLVVKNLQSKFIPGLPALPSGMFFLANAPESGFEPHITGGTSETTRLLQDINPGPATSMQHLGASVFDQAVYFGADDGEHGIELWRSDGTPEGTVMLKDISPGGPSGDPRYFTPAGGRLFFVAEDGEHGPELWSTDGTAAGTALVGDILPGPQGSDPWSLAEFKNHLWFCAKSSDAGEEIFLSDGTDQGTRVALDIVPGTGNSGPGNLTSMRDALLFTCDDGIHGEELWVSDGTPNQTHLVRDIWPPRTPPGANPRNLTAFEDRLFFSANDAEHGEELWSSDGAEDGTTLVGDIVQGPASSWPAELTPGGKRLFFSANRGLWMVENSLSPQLTKITTGDLRDPRQLAFFDGRVHFSAGDPLHGCELWTSDGTQEGTRMVRDITPGTDDTVFLRIFTLWDTVWFYAKEAENRVALWVTDGTETGTWRVLGMNIPCPDWNLDAPDNIPLNYTCDPAGKVLKRALLVPLVVGPDQPTSTDHFVLDSYTYFACRTASYGSELCRTDGTLSGTEVVCDCFPGPSSSGPDNFCVFGKSLCFIAEHPREGRVVFCSDGTRKGTQPLLARVGDVPIVAVRAAVLTASKQCLYVAATNVINDSSKSYSLFSLTPQPGETPLVHGLNMPKTAWNEFRQLTPVGDRIFFTFNDGVHGEELWTATDTPGSVESQRSGLVKDILTPAE